MISIVEKIQSIDANCSLSLDFVCFNLLLIDIMESTIRFVNSNNQYDLDALHEEVEDVDISQEGESLLLLILRMRDK